MNTHAQILLKHNYLTLRCQFTHLPSINNVLFRSRSFSNFQLMFMLLSKLLFHDFLPCNLMTRCFERRERQSEVLSHLIFSWTVLQVCLCEENKQMNRAVPGSTATPCPQGGRDKTSIMTGGRDPRHNGRHRAPAGGHANECHLPRGMAHACLL